MPMAYTKEEFIREAFQKMVKDPVIIEMALEMVALDRSLEGMPMEELVRRISMEKIVEKKLSLIRWPLVGQ